MPIEVRVIEKCGLPLLAAFIQITTCVLGNTSRLRQFKCRRTLFTAAFCLLAYDRFPVSGIYLRAKKLATLLQIHIVADTSKVKKQSLALFIKKRRYVTSINRYSTTSKITHRYEQSPTPPSTNIDKNMSTATSTIFNSFIRLIC